MKIGEALELGIFQMPSHPPERGIYESAQWDLQVIRWAEEFGYNEAWIGEHLTQRWENCPAPDLLMAQAFAQTKNIRIGAGTYLLPQHHPSQLAIRVAYLDHLSQGRLMVGVGVGISYTDHQTLNIDASTGEHRKRFNESLEILLKYWNEREPWEYKGNYWTVRRIAEDGAHRHLDPVQYPHPPIGVAGSGLFSPTLEFAGERGFMPLSLMFSRRQLMGQLESIKKGAARSKTPPRRKDWRIVRDIMIADTDAEAMDLVVNGFLGRMWIQYFIPTLIAHKNDKIIVDDPNLPLGQVTAEYLAKNQAIVGSPDTAYEKICEMIEISGGFGTLVALTHDYLDAPDAYRKSMRLLAKEVIPRVREKYKNTELPDSFL
jgi:alkanesulfonate monooxygenase SsuD/methylene tetrahydromethanopterin reductase-like flavin-dependent oxidoreductase (luciferase family)